MNKGLLNNSDNGIKGVLFDLDGTLADTIPDLVNAWKKAFKDYGIKIQTEDYCRLEGMKLLMIAKTICYRYGNFNENDFNKIIKLKDEYYMRDHKFRFYDGVPEIIEDLIKMNKKLAIVSASPKNKLYQTVPKTFRDKFDVIITMEDTLNGKPHPEPYLNAIEKLNLENLECIVVENAPLGIESAKNAGCYCIALSTTLNYDDLKKADIVLKNHAELREYLRRFKLGNGSI